MVATVVDVVVKEVVRISVVVGSGVVVLVVVLVVVVVARIKNFIQF